MWTTQFEALDVFGVDINQSGSIVVTGFFAGTIRIGDKVLESQGSEDIFILIFNKEGEVLSMKRMIAFHE